MNLLDPGHELYDLALSLYRRMGEATIVRPAIASRDDWTPCPRFCHDNVREWVQIEPRHKAVSGFQVFNVRPLGFVQFNAHSVIETEAGELFDITPQGQRSSPFLRHTGTDAEFAAAEHAVSMAFAILPAGRQDV